MNTTAAPVAADYVPTTRPVLVTKGAGKAVHLGYHAHPEGGRLVTLCDGWGATGARPAVIRRAPSAEAATCKSCLRANGGYVPR